MFFEYKVFRIKDVFKGINIISILNYYVIFALEWGFFVRVSLMLNIYFIEVAIELFSVDGVVGSLLIIEFWVLGLNGS